MDTQIVAVFCLVDDMLKAMRHQEDLQCEMSDAEVMTTAILAVVFVAASAAAQGWQAVKSPTNETITGICAIHPDTLFIVTAGGNFARTDDACRTWQVFGVKDDIHLEDISFASARVGLVCARSGRVDAYRVVSLLDVRPTEEPFERPSDFDLAAFWKAWCARRERWLSSYTATVRVAPSALPILPRFFGHQVHEQIAQAGPPDAEGWTTLALSFESFHDALHTLLGFGRAVEVLAPRPLRASVLDFAQQIVEVYAS